MKQTQDPDAPRVRPLAVLALAVASLWILTGALFKLLAGSPALLPAFMRDLPLSVEVIYPLVIGIELGIVSVALLRPRTGWVLVALQYVAFFGVLAIQIARGEESCGCMGSDIELAPTTMLAIDGAIFAGLLLTRPWSGLGRLGLPLPLVAAVAVAVFVTPRFVGRGQAVDPAAQRAKLERASQASVVGDSTVDPEGDGARTAPGAAERTPDGGARDGGARDDGADAAASDATGAEGGSAPGTTATAPKTAAPEPPVVSPPAVASSGWTILDPKAWVGQDVYSTKLAEWMTDPSALPFDGTIILYRYACDHCAEHLIEVANNDDGTRQIGLVRVPEPTDSEDNRVVHIMPQGGHVLHGELMAGVEYVLTTPAEAEVVGGIVQSAFEGL